MALVLYRQMPRSIQLGFCSLTHFWRKRKKFNLFFLIEARLKIWEGRQILMQVCSCSSELSFFPILGWPIPDKCFRYDKSLIKMKNEGSQHYGFKQYWPCHKYLIFLFFPSIGAVLQSCFPQLMEILADTLQEQVTVLWTGTS